MPIPTLVLAELQQVRPIVDAEGRPTPELLRNLNNNNLNIRTVVNQLAEFVEQIVELNNLITEVGGQNSMGDSYVTGLTLEAFNDGADCHVDISDHTRVYGDGSSVAVNGGTLSGIPHDTIVRPYYDQASKAGGAVTYLWTSDIGTAAQSGDRHSVGAVVTPRAAEVTSIRGSGVYPPGYAIP